MPLNIWGDILFSHPLLSTTALLFNSAMNTGSASHEQGAYQASEFIKAIFGWQQTLLEVTRAATMFCTGWLIDAQERKKTRTLALNVIWDTVS